MRTSGDLPYVATSGSNANLAGGTAGEPAT